MGATEETSCAEAVATQPSAQNPNPHLSKLAIERKA